MKWQIPAKTFLLGEYIAIAGDPAIVLTTTPCFNLELRALINAGKNQGIHDEAPAARFWKERESVHRKIFESGTIRAAGSDPSLSLHFYDAYEEQGGLGASSAQFLAAYLASCHLIEEKPNLNDLQNAYYHYAWNGEGLRPSAYDLLAQSQNRCVYITRNNTTTTNNLMHSYDWSFSDISFVLLHSGQKMATHQHLQSATMPNFSSMLKLKTIVEGARVALERSDADLMINAIQSYQKELQSQSLTIQSSLEKLRNLKENKKILAAKGCGAMGSDIILLIVEMTELAEQVAYLSTKGWRVLATSQNLYKEKPLIGIGIGIGIGDKDRNIY